MPSAHDILANLERIATGALPVAIAWHGIAGIGLAAILAGLRPSRRLAAAALSAPLASVSVSAWLFGNPFNGAVFALLASALAFLAANGSRAPMTLTGRAWARAIGTGLVAFGWCYPHFLPTHSPFAYLYAAPLALIPCPTLAFASGCALLGGGLVGGAWRILLACAAAFYAAFGVLRLGVWIDAALLVGALGLWLQHCQDRRWRSGSASSWPAALGVRSRR